MTATRSDRSAVPTGQPWWKTAVVYQIYPRSFADADGDGIGDLRGIVDRVDYLARLGVDVVWLSPVYPSPQADNGYDVSDYTDIDPMFGTLADFDELRDRLHALGIKLLMDLVVNHTSDEHPWFAESRSSTDNAKRDWYCWRPPIDGGPPNNWASFFSGSAWQLDETTGEYYLHLFATKQPDLNWENAEVRHAIYTMMRWWLGRGVDGFRMDVVNLLSKHPALPDAPLRPGEQWADSAPYTHVGPRLHEFLQEMHRKVLAPHADAVLTVGEMPGVTVEQARLFTDPARNELDMVFQFEHVGVDYAPDKWHLRRIPRPALESSFDRWQEGLAEVGWNSLYWGNHDQPRAVSRFGDDGEHRVRSAKLLATVLHMQRGTPYIYQGEELGMTNYPFRSLDDYRDIESQRHYAEATAAGADPAEVLRGMAPSSRDNARTPMQWDGSPFAGFSAATPWIPVHPNFVEINAAAAEADPDSIFHHYRRLIELRHHEPVVALGAFTALLPDDEHVYAFTRSLDGLTMLTVANFSSGNVTAALPDAAAWARSELVLANYPAPTSGTAGLALALRPWEARVYRRRDRAPGP